MSVVCASCLPGRSLDAASILAWAVRRLLNSSSDHGCAQIIGPPLDNSGSRQLDRFLGHGEACDPPEARGERLR